MLTRKRAAKIATAAVKKLDKRLDANTEQHRVQEAALAATLDKAAALKVALKASTKERAKVRNARKDARKAATKANQRAAKAEARYDDAVLADMLRREKNVDLSAHTADVQAGGTGGLPASDRLINSVEPDAGVALQGSTTTALPSGQSGSSRVIS